MNGQRTQLIVRLLLFVVLTVSGVYVFVYLYRWQWNRALISGVFLLVSEIALATMTVLARLRDLEGRLGDGKSPTPAAAPSAGTAPPGHGPGGERWFPWLGADSMPMAVFVPVLMGVGVVLSALAYAVDRTAAATTGRRMTPPPPLALPPGGLLDGSPMGTGSETASSRRGAPWRRAVAFVALAALGLTAIDVLADATQTRPDAIVAGSATVVELEIHHRRDRPVLQSAYALWGVGSMVIPRGTDLVSLSTLAPDRVRLVLRPALGTHARQRFVGAVEDAVIDSVVARVVSVRSTGSQ